MRVAFDPYVLDTDTRQLLRRDTVVHLSPKAFELLSVLVAERPKALSKSDLQERLWPGTFVVEKNLANLVSEIREALGDEASRPTFIRTVHRFGYAFREPSADTLTPPRQNHGPANRVRLKWIGGEVTLVDGSHVLGRDPDGDVYVNAASVSRRHARITIVDGHATIDDLGSKNGTFVGEHRVDRPRALSDGDVIGLGALKMTFTRLAPLHSTRTEGAS